MMVMHSAEHENVLRALITGDMQPEDPRAADVLTACVECRRKLEDLRALSVLLEETAREERELLASIDPSSGAPGADRVAPFFRARAAEIRGGQARPVDAPAPARRFWPSTFQLLAAAAAVILLAWVARTVLPEPTPRDPTRLGGSSDADMDPHGPASDFARFRWSFARPPGGWYQLVVLSGELGVDAPLHTTIEHLTEKEWHPSAEIRADWPDTIRWQVIVRDATGGAIGVHETSAQRSSP
jgi:hypothetical protein